MGKKTVSSFSIHVVCSIPDVMDIAMFSWKAKYPTLTSWLLWEAEIPHVLHVLLHLQK